MNKSGKSEFPWMLVLIGVVAVLIFYQPANDWASGLFSSEGHALQVEQPENGVCPEGYLPVNGNCVCSIEDTSVSMRAYEKDNPSTTGGMSYFQVYVNDMELSDTDGSFTASPGDDITVYALSNSTDGSAEYYTVKDEFTVGCAGTLNKEFKIPAPATAVISFYNEDSDKIVAATAATHQDVDINEEISSVDMKISGVYEDYFSPSGPMVAVFKFYDTHIDDVKITSCDSGRTVKSIATPKNVSSETGYAFSAFEIGPTGTLSSEEIRCNLLLDAGATNPDGGTANISVTLMDSDYFKPSDENFMVLGIENTESRISVGAADVTGVLVISDD